jgi:hypothetical protein
MGALPDGAQVVEKIAGLLLDRITTNNSFMLGHGNMPN